MVQHTTKTRASNNRQLVPLRNARVYSKHQCSYKQVIKKTSAERVYAGQPAGFCGALRNEARPEIDPRGAHNVILTMTSRLRRINMCISGITARKPTES